MRESRQESKSGAEGPTSREPVPTGAGSLRWDRSHGALTVWVDSLGQPVDGGVSWWSDDGELVTVLCGEHLVGPFTTRTGAVELLWDVLESRGEQLTLW